VELVIFVAFKKISEISYSYCNACATSLNSEENVVFKNVKFDIW
jgi:hypothetical protein